MQKPNIVSDIMSRAIFTIYEEENLTGVESGMQHFRFRHLPVVDGSKLVGLITHRSLLQVAASSLEPGSEERTERLREQLFARDVMVRDVITVSETTPLWEAGHLMWENKIGCLPVVTEAGVLVGIVTEADFVQLAVRLLDDPRPLA